MIVHAGEHTQRGRIHDLGTGGMFVLTTVAMPERLLARSAELEIRLDGPHAQWLAAAGKIARINAHGFAVSFDKLSAPLFTLIDEISTASHARRRVMSAVLVDANPARRAAIAAELRSAGCAVIEATTPLEAIVRLGESSFEPDLIAIADSAPSMVADELRAFVARDHPRVKLVTIGDELADPGGIAHWLSSADPDADLQFRVRQLLGRAC